LNNLASILCPTIPPRHHISTTPRAYFLCFRIHYKLAILIYIKPEHYHSSYYTSLLSFNIQAQHTRFSDMLYLCMCSTLCRTFFVTFWSVVTPTESYHLKWPLIRLHFSLSIYTFCIALKSHLFEVMFLTNIQFAMVTGSLFSTLALTCAWTSVVTGAVTAMVFLGGGDEMATKQPYHTIRYRTEILKSIK